MYIICTLRCLFIFQDKAETKNNVWYLTMFITNILSRDFAMLFYCEGQVRHFGRSFV